MEYAIGIDLGGTKIETDIVSSSGKVMFRYRVPTEAKSSKEKVMGNLLQSIKKSEEYAKKRNIRINGIGIGTPGFILPDGKSSLISNIPSFEGINLVKDLKKQTKRRIWHENDANCFALAEHVFGAAKKTKNSIGIIWGTGIGSGIIINDRIYTGYRGSAGEFGHSVIDPKAPIRCGNCSKRGDIESFCSAPNLIKYYYYFGGKKEVVDSTYIMKGSDRVAKKVMNQCINYLCIGMAVLVNTLNPEIIVMGGGISNSSHYRELNRLTDRYVAPPMKGTFRIVKHKISDNSGVLGAAALVFGDKN